MSSSELWLICTMAKKDNKLVIIIQYKVYSNENVILHNNCINFRLSFSINCIVV